MESNHPDVKLMRLASHNQCSNPRCNMCFDADRTRTNDPVLKRQFDRNNLCLLAVYAGIEPAISCVTGRRNSRYSNTPNKQTTFQTERPILDLNVRTYPRVSFRARNSRGLRSYRCLGLLRLSQQMRARLTKVCTFCQLLSRMKLKVVGREGFEPPAFLVSRFYRPLPSPVGHTYP